MKVNSEFVKYVNLNMDSSDFKLKFQPQFSDDLQYYSNQKFHCEHSSYKRKVIGKVKKIGKLFFFSLHKVRKTNENKVFKVSDDIDLHFNKPKKSLPVFCNEKDYNNYLNSFKFDVTLKDFDGKNTSSILKKITLGLDALKKGKVNQSINVFKNINSIEKVATQNKKALDAFNDLTVDTLFQIYPALGTQNSYLNSNHKNSLTLERKKEIVSERLNLLKEKNKSLVKIHADILSRYHDYSYEVANQKDFVFKCIDEVMQLYGVDYDSDNDLLIAMTVIYNRYFSDPMTLFNMDKSLWTGFVYDIVGKEMSRKLRANLCKPSSLKEEVTAGLSDNLKHFLQFGMCNENSIDKNVINENHLSDAEANIDNTDNDSAQEETKIGESSSLPINNNAEPSQSVTTFNEVKIPNLDELSKVNNTTHLMSYWENSYKKLSEKEVKQQIQSFEDEAEKFFQGEKISYRVLQNEIKNYRNVINKQLINVDAFFNFAKSAEKTKISFVTINKNIPGLKNTISYLNQQRVFFEQTMRDLSDLSNKLSRANFKRGVIETHL